MRRRSTRFSRWGGPGCLVRRSGQRVDDVELTSETGRVRLAALLVLASVVWAYWPAFGYGFLHYDDPLHVTDNSFVQQGLGAQSVAFALTSARGGNWHPLTWLSHMLDVQLVGLHAGWHHRMNVALHAAAALALLVALAR